MKKTRLLLQLEFNGQFIYQIFSDEITGSVTIGRSAACTWRIPPTDKTASNRHAEISVHRGKVFIRDLNSHNGLFFMGQKIAERTLAPGDRYGIGDTILIVSVPREDPRKATAFRYHRLEQLNGKNRKKFYELSQKEYIIGSDAGVDIPCGDSMVSHHHAKLQIKEDGSCWITDLGSRNGTEVNHLRLSPENTEGRLLQHGDIVSIVCIDFKFYDKDVNSPKSYLGLKILSAFLTVVILLSGYFFWQSMLPSAKDHIEKARRYAERKQFTQAMKTLELVDNARHADIYSGESGDLKKQIANWQKTVDRWEETKQLLIEEYWLSANEILVTLVSGRNDLWNWNDSEAVEEKRNAKIAADLLEVSLHARTMLADPQSSLPLFQSLETKFRNVFKLYPSVSAKYLIPLWHYAKDLNGEVLFTMQQMQDIEKIAGSVSVKSDVNRKCMLLQKMEAEINQHIRTRKEKKLIVSLAALQRCRLYQEPMKLLREAQKQFEENLDAAASLDFGKVKSKLSLPSTTLCAVAPAFTTMRSELLMRHEVLLPKIKQLRIIRDVLANDGITGNGQPAFMAKVDQESFWANLAKCDCFTHPASEWSLGRTSPFCVYDRFLGVEVFWEYLRNLPDEFDASIMDDKPFEPEIITLRRCYQDLESFKSFLNDPVIGMILERNVSSPKLLDLAGKTEGLLSRRESYMKRQMQYAGEKKLSDRESLIIRASLLLLNTSANKLFAEEPQKLADLVKKIRRETESIANMETSPEQQILNRRKIVQLGIPGDSVVRFAFNAISAKKGKVSR